MIKRTIVAAAAGVAFVLAGSACEDEPESIEATEEAVEERVEADYDYEREPVGQETTEEQYEATDTTAGTAGGAAAGTTAAGSDKFAQEQQEQMPGAGLGMTGMEEEREELGMGPAPGQEALDQPMAQQQGEPTSTQSNLGYSQTLARIQRELRTNDMQVVGRVRLNQQPAGEQMGKPEETQAGAGEQPAQPRGQQRAELILFADPNGLGVTASDPMQALSMPTAILVYEDELSGEVFVAFDDPSLAVIVDTAVGQQQQGTQQQGMQQQPGQQQPGMQQQQPGQQQQDWESKPEEEQPGRDPSLQPEPGTGTGAEIEQEPDWEQGAY